METKKYILTLNNHNAKYEVTYKGDRFFQVRRLSGYVSQSVHQSLLFAIPQLDQAIPLFEIKYQPRITFTRIEKETQSDFAEFMEYYSNWFFNEFDFEPKIDGVEGSAMKKIITHLTKLDEFPIFIWQQILSNWNTLPEFYMQKPELKHINSNLTFILNNLKKSKGNDKYTR